MDLGFDCVWLSLCCKSHNFIKATKCSLFLSSFKLLMFTNVWSYTVLLIFGCTRDKCCCCWWILTINGDSLVYKDRNWIDDSVFLTANICVYLHFHLYFICSSLLLYTVSQKVVHQSHGDNFVNSKRIFKILRLLEREVNFQQNSYNTSHRTFSMLPHYLVKVRSSSFGISRRR